MRLLLARELAEALEQNPLVAGRVGLNLTLHFGQDGGEITLTQPYEGPLKALLLDVGPFIRSDEDAYLPAVMTLAVRHFDDPELVHAIESAQHYHRTSLDSIHLNVNGQLITGEKATYLWMNSAYFHRDLQKAAVLASHGEMAAPLVRHQFLTYLIEMIQLAIWVGSVIAKADERGVIRDQPVEPALAHPHSRQSGPGA
jgi:hypothetical protein